MASGHYQPLRSASPSLPSTPSPQPQPQPQHRRTRRPALRPLRCFLVAAALSALAVLSAILLLRGQYLRLCLPGPVYKLSPALHDKYACSPAPVPAAYAAQNTSASSTARARPLTTEAAPPSSTSALTTGMGRLADFLQSQNQAFIDDLRKGNGKGWHLVNGNEAGDLDSISSAVAFAFLNNALNATRTVPLVMTPSKYLRLRPENLLACKTAEIGPEDLLSPEDLPVPTQDLGSLGVRFDLVDHNRLLPDFGDNEDKVDCIIDHHEDEQRSPNAKVREIVFPTGSSSSLVTRHFQPQWQASISSPAGVNGSPVPRELATLLLSSIMIDTQDLKEGGKATDLDRAAAAFLYPLSTFVDDNQPASMASITGDNVPEPLLNYGEELIKVKFDVSGMSTHDLLLRDYKQYIWHPKQPKQVEVLDIGLATVPMSLKDQLEQESDGWTSYLKTCDEFMDAKKIDVLGVLTTYKSEKKHKGKREILLIVRPGLNIADATVVKHVSDTLAAGLDKTGGILDLQPWSGKGGLKSDYADQFGPVATGHDGRIARVWDQGNAKSTRKQVAPAIMDIVHDDV